jgi:hypothetical protein
MEKANLLAQLRGQKVILPNLWNEFREWPVAIHEDLESIRAFVDEQLNW